MHRFITKNTLLGLIVAVSILAVSCDGISDADSDLGTSLDPIENVVAIDNADQVQITVNRTENAYFRIAYAGIGANDVVEDGERESWCIDWKIPIDSNDAVYTGVKLYSTENVRGWERLNYLLNIKDELLSDMDITYREIQLVIWSLRGTPQFNLNEVALEDLPPRMRSNGEAAFSYDKVNEILSIVEAGYEDLEYESGTLFAVIGETPPDVQTVISVVEKR